MADARPDFSRVSSAPRMEMSVAAGIGHIQTFIRPQVVLTNDPSREDAFFIKSLRSKVSEIGKSVIELPPNAAMNLMWIARLDSSSLAGAFIELFLTMVSMITEMTVAWRTTYVDLLIHAPPDSSGSLLRLLKSIEAADYFGSRCPHLRIELPADIDPPTWNFIQNLVWPPVDESGAPHTSQVSLRHKISRRTPTAEEASVHLVESFYPTRPRDSHVLLLSPQVELSPLYYHYLMYILLEYKYSSQRRFLQEPDNLMGIALDLPSHHLNDSQAFVPPILERPNVRGVPSQASQAVHFLWQSPDSNAALYFGDKWVEFHSFLAARISALKSETPRRKKLISEKYPSWMEYLLELMRARGYSLLYPNFPSTSGSITTLHNELYQPPEEFSHPHPSSTADQPVPTIDTNDPFSADTLLKPTVPSSHSELPLLAINLHSALPQHGDLSDLAFIPLVSYDGNVMSRASSDYLSSSFAQAFRREIGACTGNGDIWIYQMSANDLFCNLDNNTHPDESDEVNDYESADPQVTSKVGTKAPVSTAQQDDSDLSQAEFAAHMGRQGGKVGDAVSAQAAASPSAKVTASIREITKDEPSGGLARPGAEKPAGSVEKTFLDPGLKPTDDANIKEAHDTVVMQTDHAAGRKPDDTAAMPADHVAGKKGEHAVIKIPDQAAENSSREGTVKVPAEEKAKMVSDGGIPKVSEESSLEPIVKTPADDKAKAPDQGGSTKTAVSGADVNADTKTEEGALGRKPGW